jgi:hypothetical protein
MWIFWVLAGLALLRWGTRVPELWLGTRRTPGLDRIAPAPGGGLPRLSIVVPARNEEATVEPAMRTLLALDYPDLEIVAVDDRSTDRTGEILDRLATGDPRLRVLHVRELPSGWLGKNHALHAATAVAAGPWILFTDADVHFEPTALRRAVGFAEARRADHLVVLPEVVAVGFWEQLFLSFFWTLFASRFRPWKVSDPGSRDNVGVGAFNLVRAGAYCRAGGHAALRLEVLDDLMLGRRLKETGSRQECAFSGGLVRVRWLHGLGGIVEGLTKNVFAVLRFRLPMAIGAALMFLLLAVWPAAGIFVGPPGARILCGAVLALMVASMAAAPPTTRVSPLYGLGFPLAGVIFIYIILRSALRTYTQGGVVWRGTLYPLSELRKGPL